MNSLLKEQVKYNEKVDIFSLGLIFLELLIPFKTDQEKYKTFADAREHKLPTEFENLPSEVRIISSFH
jgi:hypothetical protein